jgi:hypothetical protein|eukprot:COSAG01_NODE_16200_length_1258_cov_3.024978_1_plen_66_part_00
MARLDGLAALGAKPIDHDVPPTLNGQEDAVPPPEDRRLRLRRLAPLGAAAAGLNIAKNRPKIDTT